MTRRSTPYIGSFEIQLREMWRGTHWNRRPVAATADDDLWGDLHGRLELRFDDRILPHMGYDGPDAVCLGSWLRTLDRVVELLPTGEHCSDDGEQNTPEHWFRRRPGDLLVVTVESSTFGGCGISDWGRAQCGWHDFKEKVVAFFRDFRARMRVEVPAATNQWWHDLGAFNLRAAKERMLPKSFDVYFPDDESVLFHRLRDLAVLAPACLSELDSGIRPPEGLARELESDLSYRKHWMAANSGSEVLDDMRDKIAVLTELLERLAPPSAGLGA